MGFQQQFTLKYYENTTLTTTDLLQHKHPKPWWFHRHATYHVKKYVEEIFFKKKLVRQTSNVKTKGSAVSIQVISHNALCC